MIVAGINEDDLQRLEIVGMLVSTDAMDKLIIKMIGVPEIICSDPCCAHKGKVGHVKSM